VAPPIVAASLQVLDLLDTSGDLRARLRANTALFRRRMDDLGFDVLPSATRSAPADWPNGCWRRASM
jgi:glycine C-acetyltransferase